MANQSSILSVMGTGGPLVVPPHTLALLPLAVLQGVLNPWLRTVVLPLPEPPQIHHWYRPRFPAGNPGAGPRPSR
jgi:hypothetical protein